MGTSLKIDEIVWRGPMVLVKLPSRKMANAFLQCEIQIYYGDECRADGLVSAFLESGDEPSPRLLLNIVGINDPDVFNPPTKMVIKDHGFEMDLPIKLLERDQPRFEVILPPMLTNAKELTV
ncbi:hypothetical protein ACFL2U_03265 [Patescibacteria group bacterium]